MKVRTRGKSEYRQLIHLLNQRYQQEFIRAERLQADVAWLEKLRSSWLGRGLRWLRSLFRRPGRPDADTVVPLALEPVEVSGRVSIIIPFRDRGELLRDCLSSLRRSTWPHYEIILVDNGSTERRLLRLLRRLEDRGRCTIVSDPSPFNFSRLCNRGAAAASGDWLLFLNNDTVVLTPDWIEQLIRTARQPGVGVAGATLLYPNGGIQHGGLFCRPDGLWDHLDRGRRDVPAEVRSVPAVTAACLLIGRELFHDLNGFDEARPVTHNDVDLCLRARERGRQIAVTPHARLFHYESLSRGYALTPAMESTDRRV